MAIFMIATIKRGKETVGIRLLETGSNKVLDVPYGNVMQMLATGKASIVNLKVENNKLVGVNGSIERYGVADVSQSCTILNAYVDEKGNTVGFKVSDAKGVVKNLTTDNLIGIAELIGISNGKIVEKDGTKFISAIEGQYETIKLDGKNTEKNSTTTADKAKDKETTGKYELVKGIIIDSNTGKPVCEQGDLTFNRILAYEYGEYIVLKRRDPLTVSVSYIMYLYNVKKDEFKCVNGVTNAIEKHVKIGEDNIILYGMNTGSYGQFYASYLMHLNTKTFKYSIQMLNNIVYKLNYMYTDGDVAYLYDLAPGAIGAFSKDTPDLRIYDVAVDDMIAEVGVECISLKGSYSDVEWVDWNKKNDGILRMAAKFKDKIMLIKDDRTAVVEISNISSEVADMDKLVDIVFKENETAVKLGKEGSKETKVVKAKQTSDRGIIVSVK